MIIAIDFDGTIHSGIYPSLGFVRSNAREAISSLRKDGHYVIIWTCRSGDDLVDAINYMLQHGIEFDRVNDNHPSNIQLHSCNCRKVYADVYVDDKQIGTLPNWLDIRNYINQLTE